MYETGVFDVSRFNDRNFLIKNLFDINNKRIPFSTSRQKTDFDLDQFKIKRHNKFNIICVDLKLEHFELAYKLWLIGLSIAFVCLISEIIMFFVSFNLKLNNLKIRAAIDKQVKIPKLNRLFYMNKLLFIIISYYK